MFHNFTKKKTILFLDSLFEKFGGKGTDLHRRHIAVQATALLPELPYHG